MNGDGLMDIVTGKCDWSHGFRYEENHVDDPPVLYWFELRRLPASDYKVECRPDVLTASRMGTFVFINDIRKAKK